MKLAVFDDYRIGVVEGESLYDITAVAPEGLRVLRVHMNWLIGNWARALPKVLELRHAAPARPLSSARLLAPSPCPSHIFGTRPHGFFLKAPGSLTGPAHGIRLPQAPTHRFDHKSQLALIIGRRARNVSRSEALDYVFGYSCLVDLSARVEAGAVAEERSMHISPETFTSLGPYLVTADEVPDPQSLDTRTWVNGKLRQDANTREMIIGIAELIERISSVLPLNPGDVVASGTPEGVGPVNPGDRVRIAIDGIGEMTLAVSSR